ncbi:MAG TPA: hypothetical protein VK123_03355 [Candidatus Limnocylindrales bacterium]|nr:hypothetical protein [Candidatus Limnocylindrales bacterium]
MTVKRGATLPFDEAERALSGGWEAMPPLVLAAGPDEFLRSRLVAAFRAGGESEGAELERLDAEALTAETLAGALASLSLFSSSRRLWIREGSKLDKECEDALVAWTRGGAEATRLLVTTAREIAELRGLQALAAAGASVACALRPGEAVRWVDRMLAEAGLVLPPGAGAALAEHAKDLLEARQEIEKLRLYAEPSGKVPAAALAALRGARAGGSLDRWADAVLARDARAARREAAALDAEGVGGTSALWAVAERALAALEPQAFAYRRGAAPRVTLPPSAARAALHAVYAADRALKRGEARDAELRDLIERMLLSPGRASHDA